MNAAEQIVEQYLQLCCGCFTMADRKVKDGNNRQLDILAINPEKKTQYHVEVSVTHMLNWRPDLAKLREEFERKFHGTPPRREGRQTDFEKNKSYLKCIENTYCEVGLDPNKIQRVFCCWVPKEPGKLQDFLSDYAEETGLRIEIWSLRDKIITELLEKINTTNYDHPILRTMSLLRQRELQQNVSKNQK